MYEVRRYLTAEGRDLFGEWLDDVRNPSAKVAIVRRLNRIEGGNFGDFKPLRDGVFELRIDAGPGYRIYCARSGRTVILILCGGTKQRQDADIERAWTCWRDWQSRPDRGAKADERP